MKTTSFIADSTEEALARIRAELGPEAMVLNVRRLPGAGISKLWQQPRVEVVAGIPDAESSESKPLTNLLQRIATLNRQMPPLSEQDRGRIESLFPTASDSVIQEARLASSGKPKQAAANLHLFVGPPGVGKTTCLSKWLAQIVLLGGRSARVWRLDGHTANTAESLSVYGEILGVPVSRCWSAEDHRWFARSAAARRSFPISLRSSSPSPPSEGGEGRGEEGETGFIDLPGVDFHDATALGELKGRAESLRATIHLVLNAAYDPPVLLEQVRAFSSLPMANVILTHLDEEHRAEKLRDLARRISYPIAYLSAGQNVPGTFRQAGAAFAERGVVL